MDRGAGLALAARLASNRDPMPYSASRAALLADAVRRIKTLSGRRLLLYRGEDGETRPITGEMINAYLAEAAGSHVTAKDFRTLHASALAGEELASMERARSPTARRTNRAGWRRSSR